MSERAQNVIDLLHAYRLQKNLPAIEISRRTGMTRGYISKLECGATKPKLADAFRYADALGFSLSEIIEVVEGMGSE